jgi:hypothetical protein
MVKRKQDTNFVKPVTPRRVGKLIWLICSHLPSKHNQNLSCIDCKVVAFHSHGQDMAHKKAKTHTASNKKPAFAKQAYKKKHTSATKFKNEQLREILDRQAHAVYDVSRIGRIHEQSDLSALRHHSQ